VSSRDVQGVFGETQAHLRRLVLLLYGIVGPVFSAVLLIVAHDRGDPRPALAVVTLIVTGAIALLVRPRPTTWDWIYPVGVSPTLCCGIAYVACGGRGDAFFAVLGAPLAWAAVLFEAPVAVAAWVTAVGTCFTALALRDGAAYAALNTTVLATIYALVGWVVNGMATRLRRTRAQLRAQRDRDAGLLKAIPDTIAVIDREGRFVDVHSPPGDALPDTREKLLGQSAFALMPDETATRMREATARAAKTGEAQVVAYAVPYGAAVRHFESHIAPGAEGTLVVVRRDVTARREAELAARESEQRLAGALEGARTGTFDWDVRTNVVHRSPGFLALLGYAPGEVEGKLSAWEGLLHPEDRAGAFERRDAAAEGRTPEYDSEYRLRHKDGRWIWMRTRASAVGRDAQGRPLRLLGTVADVDAEHREQEARLQDARLRGLENRVNEIELVLRIDGSIVEANDRALAAYGYSREEMRRLNIRDVRDPSTVADVTPYTDRTVREGGLHFETVQQRRDGSLFPVEVSTRVFEVEGDRYLHSLIRDLTEERRLEAERVDRELRLRAALVERETLLKEVHHRVKNNLQMMISLFALQGDRVTDPRSAAALLDSQQRLRSMALVHEQLYQSDDLARIDLAAYVTSLVGGLQTVFGGRSGVVIDVQIGDMMLAVDTAIPGALILSELVSNAMKYAFPGGRAGRIVVGMTRSTSGDGQGRLVLSVADDGVGLPEGLDPARTATLGLQLVHILARQLRGAVVVERQGGTRFEIDFPEPQGAAS